MVVTGMQVARELRRRRVGRADMVANLDQVTRSTWLPAEPAEVPTSLLVLACERLQLDGLAIVPSHYHVAFLAHPAFRFLEPADEATFLALSAALAPYRLHEAVELLDAGRVLDAAGHAVSWEPVRMVLPVSAAMKERMRALDRPPEASVHRVI